MTRNVEQRLQAAEDMGYNRRGYVELAVNLLGFVVGMILAGAIVAHDPAAYLVYEPPKTTVSDTSFYAFFGGMFAAFVGSAWLCGRNLLLRFIIIAVWSAFAALLAVKWLAFLFSQV